MLGIFVIIVTIGVVIYIVASEIIRGRLHDKIYNLEREKNVTSQTIDDLKSRCRSFEKRAQEAELKCDNILKTFAVEREHLRKCLDSIAHQYTVTNKNKVVLMTFLSYSLGLNNKSIYDLKINKMSPAENAKFLIEHLYYHTLHSDKDYDNILNAVITLILYNRKK